METEQVSFEKLAEKVSSGESLTARDRLMIMSRRPAPSRKEWWSLYAVWVFRGTLDLDKPVGAKSLAFLKRQLSVPTFDYLTRSLRKAHAEAVTMQEVGHMLDHGSRLRELQNQVAKEQTDAAMIDQQRAISK